ncbi:hypothetical protein LCGC14_1016180 [marine sediment metagenome]|uniref:Uncharacterized protein n=1 Tax=marine sediment metagenome TaxID=412755 RepID=A0A0F9QGY1_9ZZZZ
MIIYWICNCGASEWRANLLRMGWDCNKCNSFLGRATYENIEWAFQKVQALHGNGD